MPRLASALSPLKSIAARSKWADRRDTLDTSPDCPIDQQDAAAKKTSHAATRWGKKDTENSDMAADFASVTAAGDNTIAKAGIIDKSADVGLLSHAIGATTFTVAVTESGEGTACASTMPRLPSALATLKSIVAQFQWAARRDTLDTSLNCLVDQLDAAAKKISHAATRCGRKDTDTSDIVADFGGEATAVGENTIAKTSIIGKSADVGLVSYAIGTTTFTAAATESREGTAFASTSSYANVSGADLILIYNDHGELTPSAGADVAYSTSSTTFIAIDLEFWDWAWGPIVIEADREVEFDCIRFEIEGNAATLQASLEATGPETLVSLDANVLAVEDTLSSSSVRALLGVGDFAL
jgi:hypothetical protein